MIAWVSVLCLLCGGYLACLALKRPAYEAAMQRSGGFLLVVGLFLIGFGLKCQL